MKEIDKSVEVPDLFVRRLTAAQRDLFAYIQYLVTDRNDAMDVLQDTNVQLWHIAKTYDPARPFLPWAKATAYWQAKAYWQRVNREQARTVCEESTLESLAAAETADPVEDTDERLAYLDGCFAKLNSFQQSVMRLYYYQSWPVAKIAAKHKHSEAAIQMLMTRVRRILADCIERKKKEGEK